MERSEQSEHWPEKGKIKRGEEGARLGRPIKRVTLIKGGQENSITRRGKLIRS